MTCGCRTAASWRGINFASLCIPYSVRIFRIIRNSLVAGLIQGQRVDGRDEKVDYRHNIVVFIGKCAFDKRISVNIRERQSEDVTDSLL